jgi:hypothetical protein
VTCSRVNFTLLNLLQYFNLHRTWRKYFIYHNFVLNNCKNLHTASTISPLTQKMETTRSSETVVSTYKNARCHIAEYNRLHIERLRNTNCKPLLIELLSTTMWTDTSLCYKKYVTRLNGLHRVEERNCILLKQTKRLNYTNYTFLFRRNIPQSARASSFTMFLDHTQTHHTR